MRKHTCSRVPSHSVFCHQFGPKGDVKIFRSNPGEVTIQGDLSLPSLEVKEIKVGDMGLQELVQKIYQQLLKEQGKG